MINDTIKPNGALTIILKDKFGNIKTQRTIKNLIVNSGKTLIAERLAGNTTTAPNIMAVGTGVTPATVLQVGMSNETTRIQASVTVANNIITYSSSFPPGVATDQLSEAAIFSGTLTIGSGIMLNRVVFLPINKAEEDTLVINWQVTVN